MKSIFHQFVTDFQLPKIVSDLRVPLYIFALRGSEFGLKNTFQVYFFHSYFNKKYVEVAINDFTIHLIISKWLRKQKWRQKRKTVRQ